MFTHLNKQTRKFIAMLFVTPVISDCKAQCSVVSTCGYTVTVHVNPQSIVPSSTNCPFGYNYNVRFNYSVLASGSNTCSAGTLGVQPQINCNGSQNNGYYTINNTIPNGAVSVSDSNTLTTTTNPYNSNTDCNTATPTSLGCNALKITIYGPGISTADYNCSGFSTMPIELYQFYGTHAGEAIILKWITASEKNNKYFTLERSSDVETWTTVEHVPGAGNTTSKKYYEVNDYNFKYGVNYYRLKQTDFDGSFEYSAVLYVDALNNDSPVSFFPNPASSELQVETYTDSAKELQIANAQGKVLLSKTIFKSSTILVNDYPQGIYFVSLFEGNTISHHKLVKK